MFSKNGVLVTSGWAHCQAERQDTWFPGNSGADKVKVRNKNAQNFTIDQWSSSFLYCNACALLLEKRKQGIAVAVGDWYFERTKKKSS